MASSNLQLEVRTFDRNNGGRSSSTISRSAAHVRDAASSVWYATKIVSERLGHSTTAVTPDVYMHVVAGMDEEAAGKAGQARREARNRLTSRKWWRNGGNDADAPREAMAPSFQKALIDKAFAQLGSVRVWWLARSSNVNPAYRRLPSDPENPRPVRL